MDVVALLINWQLVTKGQYDGTGIQQKLSKVPKQQVLGYIEVVGYLANALYNVSIYTTQYTYIIYSAIIKS